MKQSKRAAAIIKRDSNVISRSVTREHSFVFKRARGMHLWDVDGKRYLDFAAGVAVANVGHTNPEVIAAIKKQMNDAMHCEFSDFYAEIPVKFAETLLSLVKGKDNIFLSNSGTESIEAAYKAARWHTNRTWTIAFEKAFHGRTMGSLSATWKEKIRAPFKPMLESFIHVEYGDAGAVEDRLGLSGVGAVGGGFGGFLLARALRPQQDAAPTIPNGELDLEE